MLTSVQGISQPVFYHSEAAMAEQGGGIESSVTEWDLWPEGSLIRTRVAQPPARLAMRGHDPAALARLLAEARRRRHIALKEMLATAGSRVRRGLGLIF